MIHFWVPADTATPADVLAWDPDLEPRRYASGVGHNLLELYARLARRGLEVSLGEEAPRGTRLVVVFSKSVFQPGGCALHFAPASGRPAGSPSSARTRPPPGGFRCARWSSSCRRAARSRGPGNSGCLPFSSAGWCRGSQNGAGTFAAWRSRASRGKFPPVLRTAGWEPSLRSRGIEWSLDAPDRERRLRAVMARLQRSSMPFCAFATPARASRRRAQARHPADQRLGRRLRSARQRPTRATSSWGRIARMSSSSSRSRRP